MSRIWREVDGSHKLTEELRARIERIYRDRGEKALIAIDERRVKRYLDFYVVVGHGDEYIVENDFCTCNDFLFRGRECWHILAVRIAECTGLCEFYDLWYQDVWKL